MITRHFTDAIFIKLGPLEVSAFGHLAISTVIILVVLYIFKWWLAERTRRH